MLNPVSLDLQEDTCLPILHTDLQFKMSFYELNVIDSCVLHHDEGEGQVVRDFLSMILFLFREGRQCWIFFILPLLPGEVWAVVPIGDANSRVMGQSSPSWPSPFLEERLEKWHCRVTDRTRYILHVLEWFNGGLSNLE